VVKNNKCSRGDGKESAIDHICWSCYITQQHEDRARCTNDSQTSITTVVQSGMQQRQQLVDITAAATIMRSLCRV